MHRLQDLLQGGRLGTVMFLLYMFVFFFILLAMFVTIVSEAFAAVCDDISKQSNDYEMVEFMIGRFKHWTGLSGLLKKFGKENLGDDELNNEKVMKRSLMLSSYVFEPWYMHCIIMHSVPKPG